MEIVQTKKKSAKIINLNIKRFLNEGLIKELHDSVTFTFLGFYIEYFNVKVQYS